MDETYMISDVKAVSYNCFFTGNFFSKEIYTRIVPHSILYFDNF